MRFSSLLLTVTLLAVPFFVFAAAPTCAGAEVLAVTPVGDACTPLTIRFDGPESMQGSQQRNCQNTAYFVDAVNWKRFTATTDRTILEFGNARDAGGSPGQFIVLDAFIYSGTCASLTYQDCLNNALNGGDISLILNTVPGTEYFVEFGSTAVTADVCIRADGTPPVANDDCAGAISLSVTDPCSPRTFSSENATRSRANCGFWDADDDVWFSFVATLTRAVITFSNVSLSDGSSSSFYGAEFFSGDCAGLTRIICTPETTMDQTFSQTISGLTVGNRYYFRVASGPTGPTLDFDVCVTTPPPAPDNDECADATTLTIEATTDGSTIGATADGTACGSAGNTGDVWYAFTAQDPAYELAVTDISNRSEPGARVRYEFFSNDCQTGTSLECGNFTTTGTRLLTTDFVVGQDYLLRLYSVQERNLDFSFSLERPLFLPAELTDFRAEARPKSNYLYWTTAREENVAQFDLERSGNGTTDWQPIGTVTATGRPEHYLVEDATPLAVAYYRLRTVDLDGSFTLSDLLNVRRTTTETEPALLTPNPTGGQLTVFLTGGARAELFDTAGRQLLSTNFTGGQAAFDLTELAAGVYLVRSFSERGVTVSRVVRR